MELATLFRLQSRDGDFKRYECLYYYIVFESIVDSGDNEDYQRYYEELGSKVVKLGWHIGSWKRIKGLMKRMKAEGFLERAPIRVQEDYWIGDGRHRFCCAMALNLETVPVQITGGRRKQFLSRDWFVENFDPSIVKLLDSAKDKLITKYEI